MDAGGDLTPMPPPLMPPRYHDPLHDGAQCSGCKLYVCDCECPGQTGYSKKRRLLREHRKTMRVYEDVVMENGLYNRFVNKLLGTDAQDWCLVPDEDLDEASDTEDPEAALRKDIRGTDVFVQAAQDALLAEALRRDYERKSMELEDLRSRRL